MDIYYGPTDPWKVGMSKRAAKKVADHLVQRANLLLPYAYYEDAMIPFTKMTTESQSPTQHQPPFQGMASASISLIMSLRDLMVASEQTKFAESLTAYLTDIQNAGGLTLIKDVYMFLRDFYRDEIEETWGSLVLGLDLQENGPDILKFASDEKKNSQPRKVPTNTLGIPSGGEHRANFYNCLYLPVKDIVSPLCDSNPEAVQHFVRQIIEADNIFFPDGIRGKSSETLTRMLKTSVNKSTLIDRATKNKLNHLLDGEFVRSIVGILNVENLYNLLNEVLKMEKGSANKILHTPAFDAALTYVSDLIIVYMENARFCESLDEVAARPAPSDDPFRYIKEITFFELPKTFPFPSDADKDFWVGREVMARLEAGLGSYSEPEGGYDFSSFPTFVAAYYTKHPKKREIPLPAVFGTVPFSTLNKLTPKEIATHKKDLLEVFGCSKSLLLALNDGNLSAEFRNIIDTVEKGVQVALDSNSHNQDSTQQLIKIYNALRSCAKAVLEMEKLNPNLSDEERDNFVKEFTNNFQDIHRKIHGVDLMRLIDYMVDFLKRLVGTMANNYIMKR